MKLRNKISKEIWNIPEWRTPAVQEGDISFFAELNGDGKLFSYKSITELNADWEDYIPAEPLIKDEKVRKAVRAWWNAIDDKENGLKPHVDIDDDSGVIDIAYTPDIHIEFRNINTVGKLYGYYTIAELCGEEEE